MTNLAVNRRLACLFVAGTFVLAPFLIQHVSAALPLIKEGDKCTKMNATSRSSSGVKMICKRVGTTKVLKWKRIVTKPVTSTTTTVPAVSTASQISIKSFAFTITGNVKSTDALSVTNHDGFTHTVTSDTGVFDVTVEGGTKESLPFLNPGTYAFHCKIHTSMHGTLTVS